MQLACHEYMAQELLFLMLITGSLLSKGLANANPFVHSIDSRDAELD
jgi:hypothetical protein